MKKVLLTLLLVGGVLLSCFAQKHMVVFYNLENLFDTINDPDKWDDEFLPEGIKKWNSSKYQRKQSIVEQRDGVEHRCKRTSGIPSKHCTWCVRKSAIHGLRSVKVNRTVRSGVSVYNAPVEICGSNGIGIRRCAVSRKAAPYGIAVVHSATTGRHTIGNHAVN